MNNQDIISIATDYVAPTYGRYELALTKGEGCYVWDSNGKKYLDFVSGLAVCNLGHCHPKVINAIEKQIKKHCTTFFHSNQNINNMKHFFITY